MTQTNVAERPYEALFICPIDTPQASIDALMEKLKASIAKENGTFKGIQVWGRRRMTFPIKRHKDGLYIYFDFNSSAAVPLALSNIFRVTDFVLRNMIVIREEAPVLPAAPAVIDGTAVKTDAPAAVVEKQAPSAA